MQPQAIIRHVDGITSSASACHLLATHHLYDDGVTDGLLTRRAGQYAIAMMRKQGAFPAGANVSEARFIPALRGVVFSFHDGTTRAFRIPDRVMHFDPSRPAIREEGQPRSAHEI